MSDDTLQVSTQRDTKYGTVPVVVNLTPGISGGQLAFSVISASTAGVDLPAKQQAKLAARFTAPTLSWRCLHASTAIVQDHHLVVTGTIAIHPDGSTACQ